MFTHRAGGWQRQFAWLGMSDERMKELGKEKALTIFTDHLLAAGCFEGVHRQLAAYGAAEFERDCILRQRAGPDRVSVWNWATPRGPYLGDLGKIEVPDELGQSGRHGHVVGRHRDRWKRSVRSGLQATRKKDAAGCLRSCDTTAARGDDAPAVVMFANDGSPSEKSYPFRVECGSRQTRGAVWSGRLKEVGLGFVVSCGRMLRYLTLCKLKLIFQARAKWAPNRTAPGRRPEWYLPTARLAYISLQASLWNYEMEKSPANRHTRTSTTL